MILTIKVRSFGDNLTKDLFARLPGASTRYGSCTLLCPTRDMACMEVTPETLCV